ncbi:MAG: MFS transporter [Candidatus Melainabacteria bacterium]|nr:MFS transporter [Candidatus Melainabacteria bacterium]
MASSTMRDHGVLLVKTRGTYLPTLIATWLGECFDAMDATIYFIAMYPAVSQLLATKDAVQVGWHGSTILFCFMLGWAIGSVVFGYIADKLGRKNTLCLTILLYALACGACALVQTTWQLALCRFAVGLGIGGEIALGAVMLGETSKPGKQRAWSMAALGTSFGVGCMLCGLFNFGTGELGWRYLFAVGIIPALVTLYIRFKISEPECFEELQKKRDDLRNVPKILLKQHERDIMANPFALAFDKRNRRSVIVVTLLATSAIVGYWAGVSWMPAWINQLTGHEAVAERSTATLCMSIGGFIGALLLPVMVTSFRYSTVFKIGFVGSLIAAVGTFMCVKTYGPAVNICAFAVGVMTYIPFIALQIYVVDEFKTELRGTAAGIAWSFGRVIAGLAALMTAPLIAFFGGSYGAAAACVSLIYLLGLGCAFFVRQPSIQTEHHDRRKPRVAYTGPHEPVAITVQTAQR